jgi:flagellar FliL protein
MAEKAKEGAAAAGAGGGGGASKIGKILVPAFIGLNVILSGGGAFLVYKATLGWNRQPYTEEMADKELKKNQEQLDQSPLIFAMDTFKANLQGEPVRGIEMDVNVEMMNREGFEELVNPDYRAKARDAILAILYNKTFEEVETVQGKLFLKDQITLALNQILPIGIVKDVYFSKFQVE